MEPKAESSSAKTIIDQLRNGDIDAVKAQLDPKYLSPDIDGKLRSVASTFPDNPPESVKTVGAYTTHFSKFGSHEQSVVFNLTYEYEFRDTWVVANVMLKRQGGKLMLEGLRAKRLAGPLEASNAFTFKDKSVTHWLMFALLIADVLLCVYAFVLCLRTPIARRKWLWALFTLVGVTTLHFDWSSGKFSFQPLSVQLLSGSAVAQVYGPLVLGLSIPLGAVWFLIVRRRLIAASKPPPLPDVPA
ncbi:hypothetical protein IHE49_13640 [Rhodanobacter sp. 7MK24]|uniref:hypothetical protein n=1 Tax=Rhodanobacter sp. 7MK24 TaxID=2775922 RepID=UPI00177AAFF3|nr:hypothetical protein [Rhodanobacter sp. 7MK24]MBD8881525.1 hypothetical protein [Rhodanobacter sp. 7MK24]